MLNLILKSLLAGGSGGDKPIPGQEAGGLNLDMSNIMNEMLTGQAKSGATGLPQQQNQLGVLPDKSGPDGFDMGNTMPIAHNMSPLPGMSGAPEPIAPQGGYESMPMVGGVQQQPMSMGGGQQPDTPDTRKWGGLIGGDMNHPNGLVRASAGYEKGGLVGALGYLMSNMDQQKQQPKY